jgi:hypothetical protein
MIIKGGDNADADVTTRPKATERNIKDVITQNKHDLT